MKLNGIRLMHPLHWLVALGVLCMSTTGCSLQKRTTTRGFHIEKGLHECTSQSWQSPYLRQSELRRLLLDRKDRLTPLNTLPCPAHGDHPEPASPVLR